MNEKTNFNVPTYVAVIDEFNEWAENITGTKGEKLAGALRAIQALHSIDSDLAMRLMQPSVTLKQAKDWIIIAIVDLETQHFLRSLSPEEKRKVLLDAKAYKDKVSQKK